MSDDVTPAALASRALTEAALALAAGDPQAVLAAIARGDLCASCPSIGHIRHRSAS